MAKALMIAGTGSGAGKSALVAGLCRIFRDMGVRVAPFKAQNMALNSYITAEGGEIGRAQAFQAEAAGIEPVNDMNPVLLKATGEAGSQVIFNGTVYGTMKAEEYYAIRDRAWDVVTEAYDRLSGQYELIIIEGAGSPAEINLLEQDIVNMRMARYADAPVVLVGDIDKGGLFASLYGTVELLKDSKFNIQNSRFSETDRSDADYIRAFIVNKFRGNPDILRPGLRMLEQRTGRPFIGVIPFQRDIGLDEEDGLAIERIPRISHDGHDRLLKVVVLRLQRISNFTDFAPFLSEPDVEFKYSLWEEDILGADLVLIPGTKSTIDDLMFMRERGLDRTLMMAAERGVMVVGICGGYQMLGRKIYDPHGVESALPEADGLGMLDVETTLTGTKTTCRVLARVESPAWFDSICTTSRCRWNHMKGYEIHMGETRGDVGLFGVTRQGDRTQNTEHRTQTTEHGTPDLQIPDGSVKGRVWGTYIHGIFDNDGLRTSVINTLRINKGLAPRTETIAYGEIREAAMNRWADIVRSSVDICFLLRQLGMESYQKSYCEKMKL